MPDRHASKCRPDTGSDTMATILIAAGQGAPELDLLKQLPENAKVIGIGNDMQSFSGASRDSSAERHKFSDCLFPYST